MTIDGEKLLDTQRAQDLAFQLMEVIKAHYLQGPIERARVLEVLNALGLCTAITVNGTTERTFATDVFAAAFSDNLKLYEERFPNPRQDN